MNILIKTVLTSVLFSMFCIILHAQKGYVIKNDGTKITAVNITVDNRGTLTISTGPRGSIKRKLRLGSYKKAYVVKPGEVTKAGQASKAKQYVKAATLYKKAYAKYKFLGWDAYCVFYGGKAFRDGGKKSEAISMLELLRKIPADSSKIKYYMGAKKLLASLYADTKNYSKALAALKILETSNNDSFATFANNLKGSIFLKQGKTQDAKIEYFKTALLHPGNKKERPEALFELIKIFRSEKNNKALSFEKSLRQDYPTSKYLKDL